MIRLILVEWQHLLNQACHLLFLTLGNNGVQWRKSWCRHLRSGSVGQLVWKGVKVSHKHRETSRCHFVHVCSLENEEPDSEKSRWKNTRFVFVYCLSVINGYVKRKHPRIWFKEKDPRSSSSSMTLWSKVEYANMMQNRCIKKTSSPLVFHYGPSTLASYWHFMSISSIPIHLFSKQLLPNVGLPPQKSVSQQIPIPQRPPQLLLCFHWRKLHLKKVSKIRSSYSCREIFLKLDDTSATNTKLTKS